MESDAKVQVVLTMQNYEYMKKRSEALDDAKAEIESLRRQIDYMERRFTERSCEKAELLKGLYEFTRKYAEACGITQDEAWEIYNNPYPRLSGKESK